MERGQRLFLRAWPTSLFTLLDSLLDSLIDYCKKHNIPLYEEKGIWHLVECSQNIIKQIEYINLAPLPNINRRILTDNFKRNKTDGDLTEPIFINLLYLVIGSWI